MEQRKKYDVEMNTKFNWKDLLINMAKVIIAAVAGYLGADIGL